MDKDGIGDVCCCRGLAGNVDNDPNDGVDVSDLSRLIDFMLISFSPLACPDEANVDGYPGIDISDLSRLIDNLFISFSLPEVCGGIVEPTSYMGEVQFPETRD